MIHNEEHIKCRVCRKSDFEAVLDLGVMPLANGLCTAEQLKTPYPTYALNTVRCTHCGLMQLTTTPAPEMMFTGYRYFSSFSSTMTEHARRYTQDITRRFALGTTSRIIEIASNDGYLLQYFKAAAMPILGIEPAANVAQVAIDQHAIPTITRYFGMELARELKTKGTQADLLIANNVLAHVPDPNDFVSGMAQVLAPDGIITVEFPDVMQLLKQGLFDTIYHEHISYLSSPVAMRLFAQNGLRVFDAEMLPVHGGSWRLYACHTDARYTPEPRLATIDPAQSDTEPYRQLAAKAEKTKHDLLAFLAKTKQQGKKVVGYGAAAKASVLLNFCGIGTESLDYIVDISPHKQGRFLPGSAIPVVSPAELKITKPDYVLIFPWNLTQEIMHDHGYIREWGGSFVTAIPEFRIF